MSRLPSKSLGSVPSKSLGSVGKSAVSKPSKAPARSKASPAASAGGAAGEGEKDMSAAAARLRSHTAELEAIFKCIDRDHDGHVSLPDLSAFMKETLQQDKTEQEFAALLEEVTGAGAPRTARDAKGVPLLSFSSFLLFVDRHLSGGSPLEQTLQPIFSFLDKDNDGKPTAAAGAAAVGRAPAAGGSDSRDPSSSNDSSSRECSSNDSSSRECSSSSSDSSSSSSDSSSCHNSNSSSYSSCSSASSSSSNSDSSSSSSGIDRWVGLLFLGSERREAERRDSPSLRRPHRGGPPAEVEEGVPPK
ncbi:hypothetical protein Efla_002210 [Eimeria flavescens]